MDRIELNRRGIERVHEILNNRRASEDRTFARVDKLNGLIDRTEIFARERADNIRDYYRFRTPSL